MLKGLTLRQLGVKIKAMREASKDFIVPTDKLSMQIEDVGEEKKTKLVPVLELFGSGEERKHIMPLAHDQLGGYLGIPGRYYDRMLADHPDLLAHNVNTWLRDKQRKEEAEKRMIRTIEGRARAFLSNKYQRIDNWEIVEVAMPILMQLPQVQIVSCEATDRRLYIQAVTPAVQGEIKKGDVVQAGVIISNSEVGCGSVSVSSVIWRLLCLNGMKGMDKFRANHVGRAVNDSEELWSEETRRTDDRLILSKVKDMVRAAVDHQRFLKSVERLKELAEVAVKATSVVSAVEVLAPKLGASEAEKNGILAAMIEGKDLSAWGLINAVTAQAHTTKDYDRAVEIEAMGGEMMNFSVREWKEIVTAEPKALREAA
jgi:hypothetical protein